MRHAYDSICSKRVFYFADGTPQWVCNAVEWSHRLGDRIQKGVISLLEFLRIRWLVKSVGTSPFYIPSTANFVMVCITFYGS